MQDPSRREILAIIRRLASLGLLEAVRPALMRDSEFGELLAQQPSSAPASGGSAAPNPQSVNGLLAYLQSYTAEVAQLHQQLSGMVFGVSFGGSVVAPGYQFSLSTSLAFSVDLSTNTAQSGLFASAGVETNSSQALQWNAGVTPFIGAGNASGLSGGTNSVQVGSFNLSANQQVATLGYTIGTAGSTSPSVSMTSSPANATAQIAGNTFDLAAPFRGFYTWLNALSEQGWMPYAPQEPFPFGPDE